MPIHALDKMGELRKNRMQVNERIVEQYEYRMGDYTGSSCVVYGYGMETQCPRDLF